VHYDHDDEGNDDLDAKRVAENRASKIAFQIEGAAAANIEEQIIELAVSRIEKRANEAIRGAIKDQVTKSIDAAVKDAVGARLKDECATILADGWPVTDNYGNVQKQVSLRDRVREIAMPPRDSYHRDNMIRNLMQQNIEQVLATQFKDVLDEAKAKFKAQVDEFLSAKLTDGLRTALGLAATK